MGEGLGEGWLSEDRKFRGQEGKLLSVLRTKITYLRSARRKQPDLRTSCLLSAIIGWILSALRASE